MNEAETRGEQLAAPWSMGDAPPRVPAPANAVDCHIHIIEAGYAGHDARLGEATVADYRRLMRRLGLSRCIVVAPSNYGVDNSCLLAALEQFGPDTARGVVLVNPDISDAALEDLHARGVRGMRVYLAKNRVPSIEEVRSMGARAKALGWSLQFVGNREREVLVDWADTLRSLPCPIVIDHFGWAPQPASVNSATAKLLFELLAKRDAYVKLSGLYLSSRVGWPDYSDLDELAVALIQAAPDKILWGTDWPHPMAGEQRPDDARMFDRLAQWAPDAAIRRKILVDNPNRLYWANGR